MLAGQLKSMHVPSCHTATAAASVHIAATGTATAGTPLDLYTCQTSLFLSLSLYTQLKCICSNTTVLQEIPLS